MNKKRFLSAVTLSLFLLLFSLTFVSAQFYGGSNSYSYYLNDPAQLIANPWVVFALVFIISFALVFFSLDKSFKEKRGVTLVISAAISFIVASAFSKQSYFGNIIGDQIWNLIVFIAVIIAILAALRSLYHSLGLTTTLAIILFAQLLLFFGDVSLRSIIPLRSSQDFLDIIQIVLYSWISLIAVGIFFIIRLIQSLKMGGRRDELIIGRRH